MRRSLLVGAVVLAVLTGLAVTVALRGRAGNGPLQGPSGFNLEGQPLPVGEPYDFASDATLLRNLGRKPITIDRVRILGAAGPLELIGVRSRRVNSEVEGQGLTGGGLLSSGEAEEFPTVPLEENRVVPVPKVFFENGKPGEGLQVVFRLRVPKAGIARSEEIEVTYRSGGRKHRETYPYQMFLCAPPEQYLHPPTCGTGAEDDPPFGDRALG